MRDPALAREVKANASRDVVASVAIMMRPLSTRDGQVDHPGPERL